jgi:hypothetical protein
MWIGVVRGLLPVGHVYSQAVSTAGEGTVPRPLGLATYCSLADTFGGLKGRHAGEWVLRETLAGRVLFLVGTVQSGRRLSYPVSV